MKSRRAKRCRGTRRNKRYGKRRGGSAMRARTTSTQLPKILLFYSEGCGHCESMKDEWTKFKEVHGKKYTIQEFEVSEKEKREKAIIDYGLTVTGFPTIFKITFKANGNMLSNTEFKGPQRTSDEFDKEQNWTK